MRRLKILMVHPHDIYSITEPWTIRITSIAEEFVKKGHEVKLVYFPLSRKERGKKLKKKHTAFETIPLNRSRIWILKNIIEITKLAEWADIVHFQKCVSYAALPALFSGYLTGKPIHYDWDDWEYKIYNWQPPPKTKSWPWGPPSQIYGFQLNALEKTIPKLVDTISVASKELKRMTIKLGIPREKIFDSPVGADLKIFNPNKKTDSIRKKYNIKELLVMYLGQLHGAQYAELFIKATRIILKSRDDVQFMVVGGGYYLPTLKEYNKDLISTNKLIFTDCVKYEQVPKFLASADICVACFEDNEITRCKSPLKIVEYLAMGKAIVASNVGEVPRMLKDAGILTKPGDEKSLAEGILELLNNEKLRRECEKKARKRAVEEYNWEVTANNILNAYKKALKTN